jgi:hypothetical protein
VTTSSGPHQRKHRAAREFELGFAGWTGLLGRHQITV